MADKKKKPQPSINWARAARDVFIKALDKGQLIPLAIALFFVIAAVRMDENHLYSILDKLTNAIIGGQINFAAGLIAALMAWSIHARSLRTNHSKECVRIGLEKSELQKQLSSLTFGSSDQRQVNRM
jgi:hypothetical protein